MHLRATASTPRIAPHHSFGFVQRQQRVNVMRTCWTRCVLPQSAPGRGPGSPARRRPARRRRRRCGQRRTAWRASRPGTPAAAGWPAAAAALQSMTCMFTPNMLKSQAVMLAGTFAGFLLESFWSLHCYTVHFLAQTAIWAPCGIYDLRRSSPSPCPVATPSRADSRHATRVSSESSVSSTRTQRLRLPRSRKGGSKAAYFAAALACKHATMGICQQELQVNQHAHPGLDVCAQRKPDRGTRLLSEAVAQHNCLQRLLRPARRLLSWRQLCRLTATTDAEGCSCSAEADGTSAAQSRGIG